MPEGNTQTYNSPDRIDGQNTYGGYSKHMIAREEFVLHVQKTLIFHVRPSSLCWYYYLFSLRAWNVGLEKKLVLLAWAARHMAVKLAVGMVLKSLSLAVQTKKELT
ncbi:MDR/zinc-dependent alcohol dehydrogenase-like family protein [Aristophania vespae]|uniref:hypothetical protein n=1 Tax=Aristophania vespae TaxID=2697033 RepID=UPI001F1DB2F9|nr:hypothetical protein [Aristophania vespae]